MKNNDSILEKNNVGYIDFRNQTYNLLDSEVMTIFKKDFLLNSGENKLKNYHSNVLLDALQKYNEPHRYQHNHAHLSEILFLIDLVKDSLPDSTWEIDLKITAIIHDCIYDPTSNSNEKNSADFFKKGVEAGSEVKFDEHPLKNRLERIYYAVLDTNEHKPQSEFSKIFCELDMYTITHYPLSRLIEYEKQIFKEYQVFSYTDYKHGRIEALQALNEDLKRPEINSLIEYVKIFRPKIGIYPGSFKPFHIGHLAIKNRAEEMFDKVIIARGVNPEKEEDIEFINNLKELFPYHETNTFKNFLYDFFCLKSKHNDADYFIIKGLRNEEDFTRENLQEIYNEQIYVSRVFETQKELKPMPTVYINANMQHSYISSSAIRKMESIEEGSAKHLIVQPK